MYIPTVIERTSNHACRRYVWKTNKKRQFWFTSCIQHAWNVNHICIGNQTINSPLNLSPMTDQNILSFLYFSLRKKKKKSQPLTFMDTSYIDCLFQPYYNSHTIPSSFDYNLKN